MKRFLSLVLGLVIATIALPPHWYSVFPGAAAPPLPPPGTRAMLPGGVGVNVVETGTGQPVLLSHGLPGSAYDWRETTAALVVGVNEGSAASKAGVKVDDVIFEFAGSRVADSLDLLRNRHCLDREELLQRLCL